MNKFSFLHFFAWSISIIFFTLLLSCGNAKEVTKLESVTASKTNSIFIKGADATKDASYAHIVSNLGRLRAMLTGTFVQYNTIGDKERIKYSAWLVNDNKDSVVIYQIPVGNYQKVGYWIYKYQVMTSLPDDPIYEAFSKLVEVSRDTIREVFYSAPDDFNITLEQLLQNPDAAFAKLDLSKLEPSESVGDILYIRQSPLYFRGESLFEPYAIPDFGDALKQDFYEVRPDKVTLDHNFHDKDKNMLGTVKEFLMKLSMMKSDAPRLGMKDK